MKGFIMQPFLLCLLFLAMPGFVFSQQSWQNAYGPRYSPRFLSGINLFREARWLEAAAELRAAQEAALNSHDWTEALYWVVLAEIAAADYGSALQDMDALEKAVPGNSRSADIVYHRARAYYYLGYYDEAIVLFKQYADQAGPGGESRKAAALYWIGECLYSMGQFDRAGDIFGLIVREYPGSVNYEAASYRLDLIKQKKIEVELLDLLKWSHEESLRTVEDYQRREKTYAQALNAYQKRFGEILKDSGQADAQYDNPDAEPVSPEEMKFRAQQLYDKIQTSIERLEASGGGSD
jgi:tetratricopeptide (TPR) repeat protein